MLIFWFFGKADVIAWWTIPTGHFDYGLAERLGLRFSCLRVLETLDMGFSVSSEKVGDEGEEKILRMVVEEKVWWGDMVE